MKHPLLMVTLGGAVAIPAGAQTGRVGSGTTTPDPAAALDIVGTGKVLLIPRPDSATRAAIAIPPTGLIVFQTGGRLGFWYAVALYS